MCELKADPGFFKYGGGGGVCGGAWLVHVPWG